MGYFSLYGFIGLLLCFGISSTQPSPKRKVTVFCLYVFLISPLMSLAYYMQNRYSPGFSLKLTLVMAVLGPLASLMLYTWSDRILQKAERGTTEHRTVNDGLRQTNGEKPTQL